MDKQKDKAARAKEDRRRRRAWDLAQKIVGPWAKKKFNFTYDDFDPSLIDGPVLVAINHACAYDPILIGIAFRKKPLTYIASEHILRMKTWGPVINKYFSIIPHQKGAKGSRTALVAMKRIKRGESIFLAVEGEQTWNGVSLPVMPYTGKLARGSGATLVTYMLEGAYLSAPRWSLSTRKGMVYGHPVRVYSPEELKGMTDEEVETAIASDLHFDTWEWQRTKAGGPLRFACDKGGSADGLERSLFSCPACGSFGSLRSEGDKISCACGFSVRMADTGFFDPPEPFETIVEWEKSDRNALTAKLDELARAAGEETLFADDGVVLHRIEDGHSDEEAARGTLKLCSSDGEFVLRLGEFSFDLKNLSGMTMVLAGRIVFSDKSGYYELTAEKGSRTNLRKYIIARDIIVKE